MILTRDGVHVRESMREIPTRCLCCSPARRLRVFRNGPRTQIAVCPSTRATEILFDNHPAIATGHFTGSLDGV